MLALGGGTGLTIQGPQRITASPTDTSIRNNNIAALRRGVRNSSLKHVNLLVPVCDVAFHELCVAVRFVRSRVPSEERDLLTD